MYAVIETGGKQYRVQEGDVLNVEKLEVSTGDKIVFDKVLVINDGKTVTIGTPMVAEAKVEGTVVENGKAKKVIIFKYKSKKDYRKKQGHRQPYTMIKIESLSMGGTILKSDKPVVAEKAAEKPAEAAGTEKPAKKPAAKKAVKSADEAEKPAKKPAAKKAEKPADKTEA